MTIASKISMIEKELGLPEVFRLGIANRFDDKCVERIYLDSLFNNSQNHYEDLIAYLKNKLEDLIPDDFLVCYVIQYEELVHKDDVSSELLEYLKQCKISFTELYHKEIFDTDNDWWIHYFFSIDNVLSIESYIEAIIGCHFDQEKCLPVEVYFVDIELNYVVNIYDDRGMDILYLKRLVD